MKLLGSNINYNNFMHWIIFFKSSHSDDAVDIWKKNSQEKSINKISPNSEDKKIKIN